MTKVTLNSIVRFCRATASRMVAFTLLLASHLAITGASAAAPPNDDIANSIVIPSTTTGRAYFGGTTADATVEPEESASALLSAYNAGGTTWWKWTCPETPGYITLFAFPDRGDVALLPFTTASESANPLTNLIWVGEVEIFDPTLMFFNFFNAQPGKTYWFAVMPLSGHPGNYVEIDFVFEPVAPPPPANDNFADRIALARTAVTIEGQTISSTVEPGELGATGERGTVWYSWLAPTNGVLYAVTASEGATSFTPGLFSGDSVTNLVARPRTLDGGVLVWPGDHVLIRIATSNGGKFRLDVNFIARREASLNDFFAASENLTVPTYEFEGSIYQASEETGEPLADPTKRQTLWWNFVSPSDGYIQIWTSAPFLPALSLFEGTTFDPLTPVVPAPGSRYPVRTGLSYYLQMASAPTDAAHFSLRTLFRATTNDAFQGSDYLEGTNITYEGNVTFATAEAGEPASFRTNTIWASWAAPATGRVRFDYPSAPARVLIFEGAGLASLRAVRMVHLTNSTYSFLAEAGVVYHFQFCGSGHDIIFRMQIDPFTLASNDDFASASPLGGGAVLGVPSSIVGATMQLGEPLHLGSIPEKSLWWQWEAPCGGLLAIAADRSLTTNVVLAVYQGTSVTALNRLGRGTNTVLVSVRAGQTYFIAAAVPADGFGDIALSLQLGSVTSGTTVVPGNLLQDPSWEGMGLMYWASSGNVGGYVNEPGSCDGVTWPTLGARTRIWQDVTTIPGHRYRVRFAQRVAGCCDTPAIRVLWNQVEIGISLVAHEQSFYWDWSEFVTTATETNSRVTFENLLHNIELDAFSVVDLNIPPSISMHPVSVSSVAGGGVAFGVGVLGSDPLHYQWYFNGEPVAAGQAQTLTIQHVLDEDAGEYHVEVRNDFGAVTSRGAVLVVNSPTNATILVQPYGDTVAAGAYFNLAVLADGTPPLRYQWRLNGEALGGATNRHLTFGAVSKTNAGVYEVAVSNEGASVLSLPATLVVVDSVPQGSLVNFHNRYSSTIQAPVFDTDGFTKLNGDKYVAQLYAGTSSDSLRAVGEPTPFATGFDAGFFVRQLVTIPTVSPGEIAFVQVRAWEREKGGSYEEARALGGKFGRSGVLQITTLFGVPQRLLDLQSFSLRAGLPQFEVGIITLTDRQSDGVLNWSLRGESGYRYLIEKYSPPNHSTWRPYLQLTIEDGSVTFTDTIEESADLVLYRARILD